MNTQPELPTTGLRLWPGIVIVSLQASLFLGLPAIAPAIATWGIVGGLIGGVAVLVWWAFFSGSSRVERFGGAGLLLVAVAATPTVLHESIATASMGMMFYVYAVPILSAVFVVWAVVTRHLALGVRRLTMVVAILLACAPWTLLRTYGVTGSFDWDFAWRWASSAEERLLAGTTEPTAVPKATPSNLAATTTAEWPGFRGDGRQGMVRGTEIETDWSSSPPTELWRRPLGPGWSSFAVAGDRLFTQEQRGEEERVSCYDARTGAPIWSHGDPVRFWEAMGGAGPRATPTVHDGGVYALGATGILNALDASSGALLWSRDAPLDADVEVPGWGLAGSPLVVNDLLLVAVSGRLVAYDLETGSPRWLGPEGGESYSSAQRLVVDGVPQILFLNGEELTSVSDIGSLLWAHKCPGFHSLQPSLTEDGDVLLSTSDGLRGEGIRRLAVTRGSGTWTVKERWTSSRLKPFFNDFVVHRGHAYGFDGRILAAIDLTGGQRQWKGGRYGNGQLLLLADQDLLLVLSEEGELALVDATPRAFHEHSRLKALTGKTWNHPVLVGDRLFVRNSQEMAAFHLALRPTS